MPKYDEFDLDLQSTKATSGEEVIMNITAPSITCPYTEGLSEVNCCM